jgi:hypothetical protein
LAVCLKHGEGNLSEKMGWSAPSRSVGLLGLARSGDMQPADRDFRCFPLNLQLDGIGTSVVPSCEGMGYIHQPQGLVNGKYHIVEFFLLALPRHPSPTAQAAIEAQADVDARKNAA